MDYFNKKSYIDKIVLKAKIGSKKDHDQLKEMYYFLLRQIYKGFSEVYPFLKSRKMDIFHDFYFYFWDAINTYDFNSDFSFSIHLKDSLIESARKSVAYQYGFEEVEGADKIKKEIRKKKPNAHRRIIRRALRSLTVKQKKVIYLHCYRHNTFKKCRNLTGWGGIIVDKLLMRAYGRINRNLSKVKKGKKLVKYREKVHKIYQQKLENVK